MIDHGGLREVLAANLRRLRIARQLSLSELARATRIGKATLSSIENGRGNPTVETLAAVAAAMRISLVELLEELPVGEVRVVRAAQSASQERDGVSSRVLGEAASGATLIEMALAPRRAHEAAALADGTRAHVYVLGGRLIAGPVERITELGPGDYASFPADVPHVYETVGEPARMLVLCER